jgi:NAD(P)-dependent dehydrogenase (short-subunit alcohol dehydrogenase family)
MNLFDEKVVLVTGAGKGAGREIARAFAARGAMVAANDITPLNLDPVVDEINAAGGRARAYPHDVAKKVDVQALVNNLIDDFGRLDILVNCAHVEPQTPFLDFDEWDLHRVFEVNAIGTLLVMQIVGRVMRAQGGGVIVNLVKIPPQAPAMVMASRAGIAAMTLRANEELSVHGIHVLTVTEAQNPVEAVLAACQG